MGNRCSPRVATRGEHQFCVGCPRTALTRHGRGGGYAPGAAPRPPRAHRGPGRLAAQADDDRARPAQARRVTPGTPVTGDRVSAAAVAVALRPARLLAGTTRGRGG